MAHDPDIRARLAGQLEALETTARHARTREQIGQHASHPDLAGTVFALREIVGRIGTLVVEISMAES